MINGYPLYGQSLSVGVQGSPALTTVAHPANIQLNLARTSLVALREGLPDFSNVETQASEMCAVAFALDGSGLAYGGMRVGVAGATIAELSEGNPSGDFAAFMLQVEQMRDLATAGGDTLTIAAVAFVQGASDQTGGNTTYAADLLNLQGQIEAGINTRLSTTGRIPLLVSQLSAFGLSTGGTNLAIQQLAAARANPDRIICVDSRCWYTAAADDLHGINTDYQRHGLKLGRAYHRVITQGRPWPTFAPYRVEGRTAGQSDGMSANLVLGTPEPPVRFSTDVITQRTNQGVEFYAGGTLLEDFASISSVTIPSGTTDTVRVGFSHPVGPGWNQDGQLPEIRYAYSGGVGNVMGAQDPDSPNGNIADSAVANGGENNALHFADPLSRHWDPRPASAAERSLLLDGTNEVTIPSGGATGAWNFTNRAMLSFWMRINNGGVHNTFIVNRGLNGAQDWTVRLFTTGGIRMVVSFGPIANAFTTSFGQLPTSGWFPVTALFNVDEAVNADRVKLYVGGIRMAGTTSGTYPSSALAGNSTINVDIGSSTNAGAPDINICQVGWWTDMGSAIFTPQEIWQSGIVRAPVVPDGTGGVPLPALWFPITPTDDPTTAGGIDNAGTGGATYDGTGTNMVAGDLTTSVPPPTPLYADVTDNILAISAWAITLPSTPTPDPGPSTPTNPGEGDPGGEDGQPPVTPTIAAGVTTVSASRSDLDAWTARDDLGAAADTILSLALACLRKDLRPLHRERVALITNAAGVNAWFMPQDFLALRSIVPLDTPAGTSIQKVTPDRRRRSRLNKTATANGMRQYSLEGSTQGPVIVSTPPPEATQVVTLRIEYHRAMDSEADAEWMVNYHYDIWLAITQHYSALYTQDLEMATYHMAAYRERVAQFNKSHNYMRNGGSPLTRSGGMFPV